MLTDFRYLSQYSGEVRVHVGVGDAKNPNPKRFEVNGPLGVALGLRIMHPAVHCIASAEVGAWRNLRPRRSL